MSAQTIACGPRLRLRAARRGNVLAVILAPLLIAGAFEGYRMATVMRHINEGRASLQRGEDVLETRRLDATAVELRLARDEFESAGTDFASARSTMRRDPLLWLAGHVPYVAHQANAALDLAEIGGEASVIGAAGVDAADEFAAIREERDGTLLEQSVEVLDRTGPSFNTIEERLSRVDAIRSGLGGGALVPPLSGAIDELDARREKVAGIVETYGDARQFLPVFLGFSAPTCYLVLAHNNAELLPTGGLVSVLGQMCLDRGRMTAFEFTDAVAFGLDWIRATSAYEAPPQPLDRYLLKGVTWNLSVSNWSPDFPTAAREAQRFHALGGGVQVDGVIGINVRTLERLLSVTGPVAVAEYGVTATTDNVFELTETYTRDPSEPEADRKEFVALLAREVLDRALHPEPGNWSRFIDLVQKLGDEKELLVYMNDPAQQGLAGDMGLSGEVGYAGGDFAMLVDSSVNGTKLNAVVEETVDMDVRLDTSGAAHTTVSIDYFNNLAPWEAGRDPALVKKLMLGGVYGDYVRLYVPPRSTIVDVRDEHGTVGTEEAGEELGLTVFGRFITIGRDERRRLSFDYVTPTVVDVQSGRDAIYRLTLRKQPGQRALPVTLRVGTPEGVRIATVSVNGTPAEPSDDALRFDLTTDYVIEYSIERTGAQ